MSGIVLKKIVTPINIDVKKASVIRITTAEDVDRTFLADGATLVYRTDTNKWHATNLLDSQELDGGRF